MSTTFLLHATIHRVRDLLSACWMTTVRITHLTDVVLEMINLSGHLTSRLSLNMVLTHSVLLSGCLTKMLDQLFTT